MKKKVLFCNEFSLNRTGYSAIGIELLTRLHNTGKYEIAELATYCKPEDHRASYLPWKVFPVMPAEGDEHGKALYNSRPDSQFGSWIFEKTCLEFQPEIVIDARDVQWMATYQLCSPFREYYSLLWMPTIDADPQMDDWVGQYDMADGLLAYSNFGLRILEKHLGKDKLLGVTSPGINADIFKPLNKKELRAKYGLPIDCKIVGMLSRNQLRKLYPDLFETFRLFIDKAPKELADNTYLHVHTGYPDQGWDIPRLIKENGLSHKVYFTYVCRACGDVRINKWNDFKLPCVRCNNPGSVFFTGPAYGVTSKTLAEIYNLYDLYVQYAALEGCGMGQLEAAACNVPIANIPYSAMEDYVTTLSAYPIKIAKSVTENGTHREWAYPDNDAFSSDLIHILQSDLKGWGEKTGNLCRSQYNWDNIAKIWESAIDNMPPPQKKWNSPRTQETDINVSKGLEDYIFIKECINKIAMSPHLANGFVYNKLFRDLSNGIIQDGGAIRPYTKDDVINYCMSLRQNFLGWENQRCQKFFI